MSLNEASPQGITPTLLVVAGALCRDGRWLMQQRPREKAHGGLWEFPGGKVEPGEAPARALARELAEELGIAVAPADCVPLSFATAPRDGGGTLLMLLYRVTRWTGEPHALEADALTWDVPAALAALPMPPVDVPLVRELPKG
jgi:8-oxo-dGTP diphosphatase